MPEPVSFLYRLPKLMLKIGAGLVAVPALMAIASSRRGNHAHDAEVTDVFNSLLTSGHGRTWRMSRAHAGQGLDGGRAVRADWLDRTV